ncbi:NAD-dependent epimerase/dehydratase family protein [Helicobacter zhangjianzhongii]|uniref:NAD-dependent epimerase/dehydratase family protein n=1 Tax=Helicobacter zhangjianzhongii TaxID=2974574 RepID=UPI00255741A8|nr:NAD-dependent epimerase/dehydratase family protein [Helicobacter sp. CPD2-1]MDL0079261.1 NAD-dependent epimerase/dehydratase family protein [Helicobacter sp. CPD2-1]
MLEEDFTAITSSPLINWQLFANANVLITGANGFLPAYMAKTLLNLNTTLLKHSPCRVLALVRNYKHAREVFAPYLDRQDLVLITQDVSEPLSLPYPIHYIIHAASPASPRFYKDAPLSVIYPNVLGTINMLNLARTNPVRSILYFSSGEVYGEFAGEIDENAYGIVDPTSLRSCYAESKRMGENLCIAYGSEYGLPVKIVRPFHTYGPGMKLDDGRVFADFVRSVVMGQDIVLTSSGEAKRSFLYLSDATLAYFLILTKGANNEAYNVANEQGVVSIKELAQIIASLFPEKGLKVRFEPPNESYMPSPILSCDVKTAKLNALGFTPKVSIEEGFSKTIRSYL